MELLGICAMLGTSVSTALNQHRGISNCDGYLLELTCFGREKLLMMIGSHLYPLVEYTHHIAQYLSISNLLILLNISKFFPQLFHFYFPKHGQSVSSASLKNLWLLSPVLSKTPCGASLATLTRSQVFPCVLCF